MIGGTSRPMTEQRNGLGEPTDISADDLDLQDQSDDDAPATSDAEEFRKDGDGMGGTGGLDAGGAG